MGERSLVARRKGTKPEGSGVPARSGGPTSRHTTRDLHAAEEKLIG